MSIYAGWTMFPVLSPLLCHYESSVDWFVLSDKRSSVDPNIFASFLQTYNEEDTIFLGRALKKEPVVGIALMHKNLTYSHFSPGFVLSRALVKFMKIELDEMGTLDNNRKVKTFGVIFL